LISVTTGGRSIADSLNQKKVRLIMHTNDRMRVIETKKEEQNVLAGNKTLQQI
jgi:hypothetical protein